MSSPIIVQVAVPCPLYQTFDYILPPKWMESDCAAGIRVRIPFGKSTRIGIVISTGRESSIAPDSIKDIMEILDDKPILSSELLSLLSWASEYYHHPIGDVMQTALPTLLRKGKPSQSKPVSYWRLSSKGNMAAPPDYKNSTRQHEIFHLLKENPNGITTEQLKNCCAHWHGPIKAMLKKGWIVQYEKNDRQQNNLSGVNSFPESDIIPNQPPPKLNPAQAQAVESINSSLNQFQTYLLDGITGSGKTEIYFRVIEQVIANGRQALVLVPEIALTPQLVERFRNRFSQSLCVMHSNLSEGKRLNAWIEAQNNQSPIIIGTRSAVFTPLRNAGVIIIDEEHDPSFKQQDGFRYHARDMAIVRAKKLNIPVILGSATPSLESLFNADNQRFQRLVLNDRAGNACPPLINLVNMQEQPKEDGLSLHLINAIKYEMSQNNQVLLFLNRRGYAPTLYCTSCGWLALCHRCDAHLIVHEKKNQLRCHHCDTQRRLPVVCHQCGSNQLKPLGHGTERVEQTLEKLFPSAEVIRIDRDSTRRKGSMQEVFKKIHNGKKQILIGTQMLAKGHHLPNVTLVGILDVDQGLFGYDFRSGERIGQLITQVSGRAGREEKPGRVIIQTYAPQHPAFTDLLTHDYFTFAQTLLEERKQAHLPPYNNLALFRAESPQADQPTTFLHEVFRKAHEVNPEKVIILGPAPAPMERRAGRYRAQLLFQSPHRQDLHRMLNKIIPQLENLPLAKKVRWSIDVDPVEIS